MLIERFLVGILAIRLTPFVNSTIPESRGLQNSIGALSTVKIGEQILDSPSNK